MTPFEAAGLVRLRGGIASLAVSPDQRRFAVGSGSAPAGRVSVRDLFATVLALRRGH